MKDHLDKNSRESLVEYRLQRAYETLNEAECLAVNSHYSGAMNRMYYACYYCVTALLIANEVMASTHNGVRSMFGMKFIKTGIIDISIGKFFNEIFELRHSNDYDDFVFCDEETYKVFYPKAKHLIRTISKILSERH